YYARRYDQAAEQVRKILEMDPNSYPAHYMLAEVYRQKAMYKEAVAQYVKVWTLEGWKERAGYQRAFLASGFQGAQRWYRDYLIRDAGKPPGPSMRLATVHAGLGENDAAFRLLEKFYQDRRPYLLYLKLDPDFDPLRGDARFADLARRLGLP
ncbi:MAG: tetratricopeptide repeat protein, partial [Gammaproteobacteria bacterium]